MPKAMNKHEVIKANYARAMNRMRSKLHFLVRDLGWIQTQSRGTLSVEEWAKAGSVANSWFLQSPHSPVRKRMEDMTHRELRIACTVLEKLKVNHFKQIGKPHA